MRAAPAVLIAALSGRALAAAARRAGYAPLVADLFGDLDTREIAAACATLPGGVARGPDAAALLAALERLAAGRKPVGLVLGGGFEHRPGLLRALARRFRLLSNAPAVVARVKDPRRFAALCRTLGVPHPETRDAAPSAGAWLRKRAGGAGGAHVAEATPDAARRGWYVQRRVAGEPVSALFLADGRAARLVGFSRQWPDPTPERPFRYGGAVRPAVLPPPTADPMMQAVDRLTAALGLVGLNSADFLCRADGFDLLEINPRPGATLDIFADAAGSLFRLHLEACDGRLPLAAPVFTGAAASVTVYTARRMQVPAGFAWPDWAADRQPARVAVPRGGPLCTVLATAPDAAAAEALARRRAGALRAMAEGA
ncbi:MAG TPA: ATP-grasp domain-containing protein [Acetobacteraceae bacterium]|nr:ATP-grasp domain-containing protein [Acetobacteraceae bacterium]